MSANSHAGDPHAGDPHAALPHAANAPAGHGIHDEAAPHGSLKTYLIGFGLSVVLTAIPFWLVMSGVLGSTLWTAIAIMVFAAVQIVVHMICFLHMNFRSEDGWSMTAMVFTIIIVGIMLSGSLWVMYHLNTNMMPGHNMSQIP